MWFYIKNVYSPLAMDEGINFTAPLLRELPTPVIDVGNYDDTQIQRDQTTVRLDESIVTKLNSYTSKLEDMFQQKRQLNLDLLDYIQPYTDGLDLMNIGHYQPPKGVGDSKLTATKDDYENLRIGTVTCERENENMLVIHATARYKPDDKDAYETDRWGYTETEPVPAIQLNNLSKTETDLVEAFVPVAVEKADGFANFRETATKTNSLIDRLENLVLPKIDDVTGGLDRYIDALEQAEELDEKIQETENLIDEIVYELYDLTDEEIEIVEQTVGGK
jgi:hypothetical protein